MVKEDNLGGTNKVYSALHEADSLYLETCKMGGRQEAL